MYRIMKQFILLSFFLVLISNVYSQEKSITGKVMGLEDNMPIPGATVILKGTATGTITDLDGGYTITVTSAGAILIYSSAGYVAQEIAVGSQSVIDVALKTDVQRIDEVVIVGYGTIKKSDLTGAVSSVNSEALKDMPITGVDQALQGKAAGVMVKNNTGAPGSGVSILVRGIGSIARSNEPLYVIDGIPLDNTQIGNPQTGESGDKINPMANINPEDIDRIEVLKDPASCAIYGARGANGVVLISTKQGKAGKSVIEFTSYYGISEVTKKLDLLDGTQYQRLVYEGLRKKRTPLSSPYYIKDSEVEKYNTNWQDEIFRTSPTYDVNLTARGGTEKATYLISGGYYKTEGIVINTGFERYSLRANIGMKLSDKISIGTNLSLSRSEGQRQRNSSASASLESNKQNGGPIVMSALTSSPVYPAIDSTGNYGIDLRNKSISNPTMLAKEQNLDYFTDRVLGNTNFTWEIAKGLKFNTLYGIDLRNTKESFFWGPYYYPDDGIKMPGSARTSNNNWNGLSWVFTNTLEYSKEWTNHSLTFLLGHEASRIHGENTYTEVGGMPIPDITTFASSPAKMVSSNGSWASSLESYFSRVNYSFKGRYLFQFNIRRDGSSRFGTDNRWGVFPAMSLGWNLAREPFMQGAKFISEMKPRFSIGKTGNQEVGDYGWRGSVMVGAIPNSWWGTSGKVMNYLDRLGGKFISISDYGYSWEEHITQNFGLDIGLFDSRVSVNFDYYNRVSNKLLLTVDLPATTGIGGAWNNAGKITNKGYELMFRTYNTTGAFKWTTEFNIASNKLTVNELITDSLKGYQTILIEGKSLHFYAYQREEFVDSLTGYVKLVDINKDGKISYGGGDDDRTIVGNPLPKFFGGISNTFQYKGFDLNIFFQFVYGNDIYNATRQTLEDLQLVPGLSVGINSTKKSFENRFLPADVVDEDGNVLWKRNVITKYPTTNYSGNNIDQREGHNGWIEDGSYLRLKTLTLGYTLPKKWLNKVKVSSARIYFSSNNLLTFTNYSGFDPEVSTITGEGIGANLSQGIDAGAYPQSKTYILGINMSF